MGYSQVLWLKKITMETSDAHLNWVKNSYM